MLPVVDDMAEARRLAAQQRRVGGDRDRFAQAADLQPQVEPHGLAGGEAEPVAGQAA